MSGLTAMPKEIEPSSYQCDCGYVVHFFDNTVEEIKARSRKKQQWLASGVGIEKHIIVFEGGRMTTMLCPRQGRHEERVPQYTSKQGRYLAFIQQYATLHGVPPAEHEMQQFFRVSPPSVHQMILRLEKKGLIQRTPGKARSIKVLVPTQELHRDPRDVVGGGHDEDRDLLLLQPGEEGPEDARAHAAAGRRGK